MVRACLLLLAGGVAAQHSRVPLGSDPGKLLIVASLCLLALPRARTAACLLLGFALFMHAGQHIVEQRLDERFAGDSMLTEVRIVDFPRRSGPSVLFRVTPIDDRRLPPLSQVSWFEPPLLPMIGDVWQFELRLRRPRGLSNPGVFDFEAWLFREKVRASGYVVNGKRNRLVERGRGGPVDGLRQAFVERVRVASGSADAAAVLAAIGVGARHLVSREQWQRYAVSGTSHLMAISGLHVGLAASSVFVLAAAAFGLLRLTGNTYGAAIVVAAAAGVAYAVVSGLGVPARRASLMLVIAAITLVRRRQLDALRALAAAAIVVYVIDPVAAMTPGFNLSFAAVALLLWIAARRNAADPARHGPRRAVAALRQLAGVQLFLLFGLMPLTVLLFQRVAVLALPTNLVAVPYFSFLTVPLTLSGLALLGISETAATAALRVAAASVAWLEAGIAALTRLPFTDVTAVLPGGPMSPVILLPALFALLPRGWPGRWLAPLGAAALLAYATPPPARGCFDAHVLDVGQGLAVVVRTTGTALLFDTGMAYRGGGSAARQVIVPFLRSQGLRRLDWLLVSHADLDHSGGVPVIREYADLGVVLVGEPGIRAGPTTRRCRAGQSWRADDVRFTILHPPTAGDYSGNDASCVLLVDAGGHRLLVTGDVEARAERDLLERDVIGAVEVVVVPHHGSLTSSSPPFVARLAPRLAIASTGYGNRWGLPADEVVGRWQSAGAAFVNTADDGAVSLTVCRDGGLRKIRRDRLERRRFWRAFNG